jgi:hypothetical protein
LLFDRRNENLIELGLACYGANTDVLANLYARARENTDNPTERYHRKGLRIAILGNQSVQGYHFPIRVIGPDGTERVLLEADKDELEALICNPTISEDLLEALYERKKLFSRLPDDRWRLLVDLSIKNERLITEKEHIDSPDVELFRVHRSIFKLLEIAPVTMEWLHTLYHLHDHLSSKTSLHSPERIDHVLSRWNTVSDNGYGEPFKGYFTGLSLKDEFRCLLASIYGRGLGKNQIHGSLSASDVALRCAYYGRGDITIEEMTNGYDRDRGAYIFSVLQNGLYSSIDRLKVFEDQLWDWCCSKNAVGLSNPTRLYLEHCKQFRKKWPNYSPGPPISEGYRDILELKPTTNDEIDALQHKVEAIEQKVDVVSSLVNELTSIVKLFRFLVLLAMGVGAWLLARHYGAI